MLLAQPQLMERLLPVAKAVMEQYIQDFTAVVNGAPVAAAPFSAYKGSIPYPGVPKDQPLRHSVDVYQKPFNSTSYDPAFNYGAFIAEEEHWLLWNLQAPAGTHCLALSDLCHILPFEHEIVFPPGSTFRITSSTITDMIYIRKEDWLNLGKPGGGLRQVQAVTDPPLLAPIYMLDMSYRPRLYQKKMHLLTADIVQEAV